MEANPNLTFALIISVWAQCIASSCYYYSIVAPLYNRHNDLP